MTKQVSLDFLLQSAAASKSLKRTVFMFESGQILRRFGEQPIFFWKVLKICTPLSPSFLKKNGKFKVGKYIPPIQTILSTPAPLLIFSPKQYWLLNNEASPL